MLWPTRPRRRLRVAAAVVALIVTSEAAAEPLEWGVRAWRAGNYQVALAHWAPLAEAGDPQAQLFLAFAHQQGKGVAKDSERAFHWYSLAAGQGVAEAQYELGLMYEIGEGVTQDPVTAEY